MSLTPGIHILSPSSPYLKGLLAGIVHLHADCIINDQTMATFLPPLSYDKILKRWQGVLDQVTAGDRVVITHISRISDRTPGVQDRKAPFPPSEDHSEDLPSDGLEVSGVVSLIMDGTETGSMRGTVASFVVSGYHRARGIGRKLMNELESQALKYGRWNLMLDTTVGTPAELVYPRLGWTKVGVVKDYGYKPTGKGNEVELRDEVWFSKDLRGDMDRK